MMRSCFLGNLRRIDAMPEILCLLAPGAFVYLISEKLTGKPDRNLTHAWLETIVYSGIIMGLMWLSSYIGETDTETEAVLGEVNGILFWKSMAVAFALGILVSLLKKMDIEIGFVETGRTFMAKRGKWTRRLAGAVLFVAVAAVSCTALFSSAVQKRIMADEAVRKKAYVQELLTDLRKEAERYTDEGNDPDSLNVIHIDDMEIRRVDGDQKWTGGSGKDLKEAVYIMDGLGEIIYFSYRDKITAATWSGATRDEGFVEKYGAWTGIGWSGPLMKQE